MAEIDDVQIGETIAVEWGNAIRDRTIQRYANATERAQLHPNPTEGDLSYLEDTNSIEVYDGFAWVAGIPNQAVTTAKIADEAVTATKIAPGAIVTSRIADLAVGPEQIANQAVTQPKIAPEAVTVSRIADGAVTTSKIFDEAVTQPKIAPGAVTFSRIAGNAIAAFERSGATVAKNVAVPVSVGNLVTVTLNIPSSWSSWECVAFAQATAQTPDPPATVALIVRIDGTDGTQFDYQIPGGWAAVAAASFRSGITTTGNRTITLRGFRGPAVELTTVFLYARAFRTS